MSMPAALAEIVRYTDDYLRVATVPDWPDALNGLQFENAGQVRKIGAAVDASLRTFAAAAEREVDFLILHHGIFWSKLRAVTGPTRRQFALLFEKDIAVYGAHLPLDVHPVVGNNACLAAAIGLAQPAPFFDYKGELIGLRATVQASPSELARRLEKSLGGPVRLFAHGPATSQHVAVITGAAGSEIYAMAAEGIDTFITGEAPHWAAVAAAELRMNFLLGGHYATETFGVKALAAHLSEHFDLPWEFLDFPTGL